MASDERRPPLHLQPIPADESEGEAPAHWLPTWAAWMILATIVLLALALTGCSGISQAEWDALQKDHTDTLDALEKAEDERKLAIEKMVSARDALIEAADTLRRAEAWFRSNMGGGVLPW